MVGNEHIGTGENDNHNLNQRSVGDTDSKYYFRLSACTKNDLPTANYTRTRDVEAQTIKTGAWPTSIILSCVNRRLGVCWSSNRIIQRDRAHLWQLRRQHLYFAAVFSSL